MAEDKEDKLANLNWQTTLQDTLKGAGPQLMQAAQGGASGQDVLKQLGMKFGAKMLGTAIGGPVGGIIGGLFNRGTMSVPSDTGVDYGPDPLMMQGGGMVPMAGYQQGVDSVPAMLTPGEAVIPAPAAQHPANQPAIQGMIQQGRAMQDGELPMEPSAPMPGPLSGKAKREEMKVMQDMSLKKKSWMKEEQRKDEKHRLAMEQTKQKGALAMRQSQE